MSTATDLATIIRTNTLTSAPAAVAAFLATANLADVRYIIECGFLGSDSTLILDIAFTDATIALQAATNRCKIGSRTRKARAARWWDLCATHDVLLAQEAARAMAA